MPQPPWKKLLEQVGSEDPPSPYVERLRERLPSLGSVQDVARELIREMASALGRAEAKVADALSRLDDEAQAIESLATAARDSAWRSEMNARIDAYNQKRELAVRYLWELRVHREAIGFRDERRLAEHYPIPPARERID